MSDGEELIEVLIKTYKLNTEVYTKVVRIFRADQLSKIYETSPMEKIQALMLSGTDN